jgi:pyruvate formate lyase activating enzyme
MIIGGIEPFSLCDFPGMTAAVVFTQGCNFKCPYCHNKNLIPFKKRNDPTLTKEAVTSFLIKRRNQLEGVVVSGGEPCALEELADFLKMLRVLRFQIKLDTNGSFPDRLEALIRGKLLDYIAMDVKAPLEIYEKVSRNPLDPGLIERSMGIIKKSGLPHQFRTTWDKRLLSADDMSAIRTQVPESSPYVIQECRLSDF